MSSLGVAGLIASYIVIAILLLSLNLYSRWRWPVKAFAILLVSAFYVVSYRSIPPLLGWPVGQDLPKKFNLVAVYVAEPDKVTGDEGEIFLWLTSLDQGFKNLKPRS